MERAFFSKNNPKKNPRLVSIRDMVVFCFAFMAPLAPTFFYARAAGDSAGSLAFGYLFAAILIVVTLLSFRKFIDEVPGDPASSAYVSKAVHPLAGFASGWGFLLLYITAPAAAFIFSAKLMKSVAPGIPGFVWILVLALIALGVNFIGTRGVNVGNLLLFAVSFAFATVFILVCFMAANKGLGTGKFLSSKPLVGVDAGFGEHFSGVALAIGSLLGIEAVMTVSAGTDESRKKLKIGILIAAIAISVFFFLQVYAAQLVWPDVASLADDDSAMLAIARRAGGSPMVILLLFSILTSATAVGISGQLAAARMLESFGDTDALPQSIFASQQRRSGAPIINHVIVFVITIIIGITVTSVTTLLELVRFGGLLGFVLMNFATLRYFWFKKENKDRDILTGLIFPAIGLLTSLAFFITIKPIVLIIGFVWIVVGAASQIANIQDALGERVSKPSPARQKRGKHVPFMAKSQNDLEGVLFDDESGPDTERDDFEEVSAERSAGRRNSDRRKEEPRRKADKESREDAIARKLSVAFDGIDDGTFDTEDENIFALTGGGEEENEDVQEMNDMFSFLNEDTTSEDPFEFEASHRYKANEFFGALEETPEPAYNESKDPLPRRKGPRRKDARNKEARYDEPQHGEPGYDDSRYEEPGYDDQRYDTPRYDDLSSKAQRYVDALYPEDELPSVQDDYSESIDEQLARAQSLQAVNDDILNQIQQIVAEGTRSLETTPPAARVKEPSRGAMMFRQTGATSSPGPATRSESEHMFKRQAQEEAAQITMREEMRWNSVTAGPKEEDTMWRNPSAPRKNEELVWDKPVNNPEPVKPTKKNEEFHWE